MMIPRINTPRPDKIVAIFMLYAVSVFCTAAAAAPRLETARSLIETGDIRQAVVMLESLLIEDPQNDAALYWLAESALAMEQYSKAQVLYSRLLERTPNHTAASHRRWLAYLAGEKDLNHARGQVRQKIKQLLAGCTTLRCQYIAYRGYKYLWDRKRRGRAMLQLVPLTAAAGDTEIKQSVPGELLEEILQARRPLRGKLAEQFLRYFPRQRGIDLASRVYLDERIANGLDPDDLDALMQSFPDNRHIRLYAARWLLAKRVLPQTKQLLDEHAQLLETQSNQEASWYASKQGWLLIDSWERAVSSELAGRLAIAEQQWALAEQHLSAALPTHVAPWRVWAALAKVYNNTGRSQQAIDAWRTALTLGATDPKVEQALRDLLLQQGHSLTSASRFFAQREKVLTFSDVTAAAGLKGVKSQRVAWGDWDNDGDADLLLDGPMILRNDAGVFRNVTAQLGVDNALQTTGGTWVDTNNDGWLDLWLYGRETNYLYRNDRGNRFYEITGESFAGQSFNGSTEASAWGDANNDGWLDLYTANYEKRGLERGMCFRDQLFINRNGVFQDVSFDLGVTTDAPLCGRGVMWADIERDGDQDIVVANYRTDRNLLWLNNNRRFVESAKTFSLQGRLRRGAYGNSVGFAIADINGDERGDIYVSNLAHPRYIDITDVSRLLIFEAGNYVDRRELWSVAYEESSADPLFADFDNDGWMDLYITSIYPGAWSHLYRNDGAGFRDISWMSNSRVDDAWGAAVADYDNDGDLDLLAARAGGVVLLENKDAHGHWLQVVVRSPQCNRFGVGARVRINARDRVQEQVLAIGRGSGSQDELVAHFGLGRSALSTVVVEVQDLCGGIAKTVEFPDRRVVLTTSKAATPVHSRSTTIKP